MREKRMSIWCASYGFNLVEACIHPLPQTRTSTHTRTWQACSTVNKVDEEMEAMHWWQKLHGMRDRFIDKTLISPVTPAMEHGFPLLRCARVRVCVCVRVCVWLPRKGCRSARNPHAQLTHAFRSPVVRAQVCVQF